MTVKVPGLVLSQIGEVPPLIVAVILLVTATSIVIVAAHWLPEGVNV